MLSLAVAPGKCQSFIFYLLDRFLSVPLMIEYPTIQPLLFDHKTFEDLS